MTKEIKKNSRNKGKRKFTVDQMKSALVAAGTINGAARILKCERRTVVSYIDSHDELKVAIDEARAVLLDTAEDALMTNVGERHPASVFFVLKTLGKQRGYVERLETTGKDGGAVESEMKVTFVNAKNKDD